MNEYEQFTTREHADLKLLTPTEDNPIGSKFLYKDPLPYIRDQIIHSLRYKSPFTRREYSDPEEMWTDNRAYWEEKRR